MAWWMKCLLLKHEGYIVQVPNIHIKIQMHLGNDDRELPGQDGCPEKLNGEFLVQQRLCLSKVKRG